MSALDIFRQELRACLGPDGWLQRDRHMRALFICRGLSAPERLAALGYEAAPCGALWRVDLSPARRCAFLAGLVPGPLPPDPAWAHLCRCLLAGGPVPPDQQPWPPIRQTLLRLDAGEAALLADELAADAAIRKRTHAPLPVSCAYLIEEYFYKEAFLC